MSRSQSPRTVGISHLPEVEILDFLRPLRGLRQRFPSSGERGIRDAALRRDDDRPITGRGALPRRSAGAAQSHPGGSPLPWTSSVIPGGYGTRREQENPVVLDWIARRGSAAPSRPASARAPSCSARPGSSMTSDRRPTGRPSTSYVSFNRRRRSWPTLASSTKVKSSPPPASQPASTWPSMSSVACMEMSRPRHRPPTWSTTGRRTS